MVTHWRTWRPLSEHSANIEIRTSFCEQYNKLFLTLIIDQYYCTVISLHINSIFDSMITVSCSVNRRMCVNGRLCSVTTLTTIHIPGTRMTYVSFSAIGNNFYCRSSTFSRRLFNLRTLKTWKFLKMLENIMIRKFIPDYYYDDWLLSTVNYKKYWQ